VSLSTLAQALAAGVMLGCFYALVALGFAMILALTHSLDLAHGELVTLGGYVGCAAWAASGLHPLLLLPIAAAALESDLAHDTLARVLPLRDTFVVMFL
jgi:branched-chain amino acid transport system permease protein